MAGEEFDDKGGDFEEGVEEGAADDAAPVAGEEADEGGVPDLGAVGPVPVGGGAGDAEVDWVGEGLHASLRNWKAQMNYRMLRMPRKPGLVKSQKLELECDLEEKATCWKTMRAMSPVRKRRKMKM